MKLNFEKDLQIDADNLDVEFLRQPSLYMQYAEESANAKDRLSRAKETLEVVRAETDFKVRDNPAAFGVLKITEDAISAAILRSDEYKKANENYLSAKHAADLFQAAVIAMDQRKTSLEQLARLTIAGYCAMPSEPHDPSTFTERMEKIRDKETKETRNNIRERINRRTRE